MADQFLSEGVLKVDITPEGGSLFTFGGDFGADQFNVNANIVTLVFPGNHSSVRRYRENGLDGTIQSSALDTALFDACGVPAVTGGLPAGRATRYYPQQGTYPHCQFEVYYFVTDTAETDSEYILTIFKAKIQQWVPGQAGNIAVQPTQLAWSAVRTLTDITGGDLPSVTTVPVSYAIDFVA